MTDYLQAPLTESASPLALALLDELRICLLECQLVLDALVGEVDLNFDELAAELYGVREPARLAFGAASLLGQGAELDESWSSGPSRPKAVFARHGAAVQAGAHRVQPVENLIDTVERQLRLAPRADTAPKTQGPRPRCTAITAKTGAPCSGSVIYLGSGSFAAHCYTHSTRTERELYKQHQQAQNVAVERAWGQRRERLRLAGGEVAAEWLQRRDVDRPWLHALTEG